ncbi:unnamed protein product [Rotaria sordida]|uniref:Uncharacterized protein n=1 Tax=Rotaria sordida TaxID=392033 RepID=A0A819IUZ4_9BILA|nr:unnamed protein product [Rotaria sordida]CAF3974638.1 unnamed protein product [Rotaria sordida]
MWYFLIGFGIMAGHHRLFAYRSYEAKLPLQDFLFVSDDTDFDLCSAHKRMFYSHTEFFKLTGLANRYTMARKTLDCFGQSITWPKGKFEEYQELSKKNESRVYVSITSCMHDDAIVAFYGSVHHHSTAGHNILAMTRVAVGKYSGEVEHIRKRLGHAQTPTPVFV